MSHGRCSFYANLNCFWVIQILWIYGMFLSFIYKQISNWNMFLEKTFDNSFHYSYKKKSRWPHRKRVMDCLINFQCHHFAIFKRAMSPILHYKNLYFHLKIHHSFYELDNTNREGNDKCGQTIVMIFVKMK